MKRKVYIHGQMPETWEPALDALAEDLQMAPDADGLEIRCTKGEALAVESDGHSVTRHLDLGCGLGSVLMMVGWRFPDLQSAGIERPVNDSSFRSFSAPNNGKHSYSFHHGKMRYAKHRRIRGQCVVGQFVSHIIAQFYP